MIAITYEFFILLIRFLISKSSFNVNFYKSTNCINIIENEGENIPLSEEDLKRIKKILSENKFEDFKIHNYYFRDKFIGISSKEPRHGISLDELKKIFERKDQIKRGFKRKTGKGYLYTLCYEESKNVFVKIGYIFDEDPLKIFTAMRIFRNLEGAVKRRYGLSLN